MLSRRARGLLALALTGALAAPLAAGPAQAADPGVLLGAASAPNERGETSLDAIAQLEGQTGRPLGLHRYYLRWTSSPINRTILGDVTAGRVPVLSVMAANGQTVVPWSRIASGAEDAVIIAQANAFRNLGSRVILGFNHEPENDARNGTPAQFIAAYRRYVTVFRAHGASNVEFSWIMMAYSFTRNAARATSFYPGDAYVDWLAADGYNWFNCRRDERWRSFAEIFAGFRAFGALHPTKSLLIAEVGSEEDQANPAHKAQWITDMGANLKTWPQVKAVSWYNTITSEVGCRWPVTSSPATLNSWQRLAADPYFR